MVDLEEAIKYSEVLIMTSNLFEKVTFSMYSRVFFTATENIKEYLKLTDFKRESSLTVLSGGDQVFNLINCGVKKIDAFDVNRLTYFVYYLRLAMIKGLSFEDFINCNYFFTCKQYVQELLEVIKKLKDLMQEDVYEYYRKILEYAWNYDFSLGNLYYGPRTVFKDVNNYLASEQDFLNLKKKIDDVDVKLHFGEAREILDKLEGSYDIILTSNIADYLGNKFVPLKMEEFENYINAFKRLLGDSGVLINYLFFLDRQYIIDNSLITVHDLGKKNILSFNGSEFSGEGFYRVRKEK